jgi:hypothetical protein
LDRRRLRQPFSIKDGSVHYFEVETGALKAIAASLDEWADLILTDDQLWTGWPFAERWAEHDAPVPPHKRLHPATPFVCGGSYEVDNLRFMDAAEMMAKWEASRARSTDFPRARRSRSDGGDPDSQRLLHRRLGVCGPFGMGEARSPGKIRRKERRGFELAQELLGSGHGISARPRGA